MKEYNKNASLPSNTITNNNDITTGSKRSKERNTPHSARSPARNGTNETEFAEPHTSLG